MLMENQELYEQPVYPFIDQLKAVKEKKVESFVQSFEGIYLFAGKDLEQQLQFCVAQALKIEGVLGTDMKKNIEMIKTVAGTIMQDQEMKASSALIIDQLGR